jgi:hypothetical protein
MDRHRVRVEALRKAVFESDGEVDRSLRLAAGNNEGVPDDLRAYVDKVARRAYTITDEEVAALKSRYTEEQLFEITVSAAVGAGLKCLEAGLAGLRTAPGKAGR